MNPKVIILASTFRYPFDYSYIKYDEDTPGYVRIRRYYQGTGKNYFITLGFKKDSLK